MHIFIFITIHDILNYFGRKWWALLNRNGVEWMQMTTVPKAKHYRYMLLCSCFRCRMATNCTVPSVVLWNCCWIACFNSNKKKRAIDVDVISTKINIPTKYKRNNQCFSLCIQSTVVLFNPPRANHPLATNTWCGSLFLLFSLSFCPNLRTWWHFTKTKGKSLCFVPRTHTFLE